jgi:hypothetical protein
MVHRDTGFWVLQGFGRILLLYLIYAHWISGFDYDIGVAMGTQESAEWSEPEGGMAGASLNTSSGHPLRESGPFPLWVGEYTER